MVGGWAFAVMEENLPNLYPKVWTTGDYILILHLKRIFALSLLSAVTTCVNSVTYHRMPLCIAIIHVLCFLCQLMVMTLLRNPSRIETASWLVLASVTIPALICGYLEGPVALCFRSLAIVVIGRVTPGFHGILASSVSASTLVLASMFWHEKNLLGIFGEKGESMQTAVLVLLIWTMLWSMIVCEGEDAIVARLKEESDHKNTFMAKMSHELRTPLVGVVGIWDMLKSSSDFERTEIICRAGGVMDSCLDSVQRLIDEVLDITKLAKGVVELDLGVWGIHDMMRAVVHLFELKAHSKSITVRYESKEPYPLFAKVDRVRLSQIVINLVSNAIKFSDDGEIVITLEVERLPNKRSNLVIAVKDHGVGLDVDEPAKLFGLFAQGWAGAARGGTGLGLAISHQLVTLMGGKISGRACVDDFHAPIQGVLELTGSNRATKCRRNDDGHGSLFHFSIPVEIKEASEAVVVGPQSDKSTLNWRPRILLAEDNDASSKIISIMLTKLGADVTTVFDGTQVLDRILEPHSFDILLLDLEMPIMSGWTVLNEMREYKVRLPTVVLTAHVLSHYVKASLEAQVLAVVSKPVTLATLRCVLNEHARAPPQPSKLVEA